MNVFRFSVISCLIGLLSLNTLNAQDTTITYLNQNWQKLKDSKGHAYYRKTVFNKTTGLYEMYDFYKGGQMQMKGQYLDKEFSKKTGEFTFYYSNGNKSSVLNYSNGVRTGNGTTWYHNGTMKSQTRLVNNIERVFNTWDSLGNQMVQGGNGFQIEYYNGTTQISFHGKFVNGMRDSTWVHFHKDGKINFIEYWRNGEFKNGVSYLDDKEYEYIYVETSPEFPGGSQALANYLKNNLVYPRIAKINNHQGVVYIEFTVNPDGSISNPEIKLPSYDELNQEAIRVIKNMPAWKPGTKRGLTVESKMILPIAFHLESAY